MMFLTNDPNEFFADELKILSLARPHCESFLPDFSGICSALPCGFKHPGF